MSQSEIIEFLKKNKGKKFNSRAISSALGSNHSTIISNLCKLKKSNLSGFNYKKERTNDCVYNINIYMYWWEDKGYTWEIKVYGETIDDCVKNAKDADGKLREYVANPESDASD